MKIEQHEILIRDLVDEYEDLDEEGVTGYGGKLDIRPKYQREMIYNPQQKEEVIRSVLKGYPLNVMYWMIGKDEDDEEAYELLDGQQRTLSICQYVDGVFSVELEGKPMYFHNLGKDEQDKILDYPLTIYWCEGTDAERLEWFRIINTAGEKLTDQELRNAVYAGPWVTAAKKLFSKSGCYCYNLAGNYMKGDPIRQELFETVLKWASAAEDTTIEEYMAEHQDDKDANALKKYITDIVDWIETLFPNYNAKMKGLPWGIYYNTYKKRKYDPKDTAKRVAELFADTEITKYSGIYEFILGGEKDLKLLSLREFDEPTKRRQYAKQKGVCPMCGGKFEYEDMHGDHITPWSKGGTTTEDNCQMLCTKCNLQKKAKEARFV